MKRDPALYEIRVRDHLSSRRFCSLEGVVVSHTPSGETVLICQIQDQAALYGLLSWLQNMGVALISVTPLKNGLDEEEM